jgi:hypothetical protein
MVGYALCEDVLVFAEQIDRSASSTIKSKGVIYQCCLCSHKVCHVNASTKTHKQAYFRHYKENETECPLQGTTVSDKYSIPNVNDTNNEFVIQWKQSYPYKVCFENNKVYDVGSPKGYIYVYNAIRFNTIELFRKKSIDIPELFILNGNKRGVTLRKTEETYWIYFEHKCELEYIFEYGGIAVIDIGADTLFQVTKESLSSNYKDTTNIPNRLFYKANPIKIDSFIDQYMPDRYKMDPRPELNVIPSFINIEEELRKEKERRTKELELIAEERRKEQKRIINQLKQSAETYQEEKELYKPIPEKRIEIPEKQISLSKEEYQHQIDQLSEKLRAWNLAKYGSLSAVD